MSDRPVLPVLTEPVPEPCHVLRVDLTETEICDLAWVLELFEHYCHDQFTQIPYLTDAFDNAGNVLAQCEIAMKEVQS